MTSPTVLDKLIASDIQTDRCHKRSIAIKFSFPRNYKKKIKINTRHFKKTQTCEFYFVTAESQAIRQVS